MRYIFGSGFLSFHGGEVVEFLLGRDGLCIIEGVGIGG